MKTIHDTGDKPESTTATFGFPDPRLPELLHRLQGVLEVAELHIHRARLESAVVSPGLTRWLDQLGLHLVRVAHHLTLAARKARGGDR